MRTGILRVLLLAAGVAVIVAVAANSQIGFSVLAIVVLLLVATSLSDAGRSSALLQAVRSQRFEVRAWGEPLTEGDGDSFEVVSVTAIGAGLWISLGSVSRGARVSLKIAHPSLATIEDGRVRIERATYVEWTGKRLKRAIGRPALIMVPVAAVLRS